MKLGLIGLGVMGRNLALNARENGFGVVATDSWESARDWHAPGVDIAATQEALAAALPAPRVVLLMVKAGGQVDLEIAGLVPFLSPGDVVIDGGNSHYKDTERRAAELSAHGIGFLGLGVSGGAEGARRGAALMAGGSDTAWETARPILRALAAEADGEPTLARFGTGGAGHFVKMIHNGIEYAIMQAIAECHALLVHVGGRDHRAAGAVMAEWNRDGRAAGFLLEITAEILGCDDPLGEGHLLDQVSDAAGQKGTGAWSVEAGLAFGAPVPSIIEAVSARQISSQAETRHALAAMGGKPASQRAEIAADLETALVATMIAALAQGLNVIARAAEERGWEADLTQALKVWRAGSILRMDLLDWMASALAGQDVTDPLALPAIAEDVATALPAWRRVVGHAVMAGVPVPVLSATLSYIEALGTETLPTALIQAQRDRFGAHGFARKDRDGVHHGPWRHPDAEAEA